MEVGIPPPLLGIDIVNVPDAIAVFRLHNELGNRRHHDETEDPPIVESEHGRRRADAQQALKVVELLLQQTDHREDALSFRLGEEVPEPGALVGGDVDFALTFDQLQLEVLVHQEVHFAIEEAFPGVEGIGKDGAADRQGSQQRHAPCPPLARGPNQLIDQQGENARLHKRDAGAEQRQESLGDHDARLVPPGCRQQSAGVHQHGPDSRQRQSHELLQSHGSFQGKRGGPTTVCCGPPTTR